MLSFGITYHNSDQTKWQDSVQVREIMCVKFCKGIFHGRCDHGLVAEIIELWIVILFFIVLDSGMLLKVEQCTLQNSTIEISVCHLSRFEFYQGKT